MTAALLIVGLLGLLLLRINLVLILMAAAVYAHLVWGDGQIAYFVEDVWASMDRELLLAVPLFVLVGQIMGQGEIARRLIGIIVELTRPFPGGLAMATVLSCAAFSSISGSSIVTMLAVGTVLYPALLENGYSRRFAIGALCAGGTLGIVIPPSMPMILYGIVTESSITDLFVAGIGPGLLLTGLFTLYAVLANRSKPRGRFSARALGRALRQGGWAVLLPVILLGGIYSGYFSPTEAAAVAILYAVLVESFIYRELGPRDYVETCVDAGKLLGALFPLIAVAVSINLLLTVNRVPEQLVALALAHVHDSTVFILAVNALLLVMGCFMDTSSAIVIAAPLLQPLAQSYGFSTTQLGIIMVLNLEIGILTPPLGMNLIVAMSAFGERFGFICRAVLPWIVMMLLSLLAVTFLPWIALGLLH
ncbi:TRAP transporter large permease [Acidimangrovimonas pyrenivorans]|uniref:TRAP transporter large permease protein n=1 Tax=Acidimangrovimonas pyrenivorans TaxID=2030798 RepID=A0ABV7AFS7_9RHOB